MTVPNPKFFECWAAMNMIVRKTIDDDRMLRGSQDAEVLKNTHDKLQEVGRLWVEFSKRHEPRTADELGGSLYQQCLSAGDGNKVAVIHLFGMRYADEIREAGVDAVIEASDLDESYRTELRKGMKLAEYAEFKKWPQG